MWKNDDFPPFLRFPFIPWPMEIINIKAAAIQEHLEHLPAACQSVPSDDDDDDSQVDGEKEKRIKIISSKNRLPSLDALPVCNNETCNATSDRRELERKENPIHLLEFPPIHIESHAGERWRNTGLDAGGEFVSHSKTVIVDQSPYKNVDITEREKTDVVKIVTTGCPLPGPPPPPLNQVTRLACSYPPVVYQHEPVHGTPRQTARKTSYRGSSPCPTRSPCSSPTSSLGDELSSIPTNPLWTSFRDRYIEEQDEGGTSDASQSLLREIRRLRRMNDEAMSLLTALQTPGLVCDKTQVLSSSARSRNPRYLSFKETRLSTSQEQVDGTGGAAILSPELESLINRLMDNVTLELSAQIRSKVIAGVIDYLRQNPQLVQQIKKPDGPSGVHDVSTV